MSGRGPFQRLLEALRNSLTETEAVPAGEAEPASPEVSPDHHAELGDGARDQGLWADAARHYARALELRPVWPGIRVQLGHALKEAGRLHEAEEAYRRASLEAPTVADTFLQLGHVLKLQGRLAEAEEAYLASLARDPAAPHARAELKALGVSAVVMDRHIAALRRERGEPYEGARPLPPPAREALVERPVTRVTGRITALTATTIRGELWNVDPRVTPVVVCRQGAETIALAIVEAATSDGFLPCDHRDFEITLPGDVDDILSVTLEPDGQHLAGSPIIPPGPATGALLARLAAIEAQLGRGGLEAAVEKRLERRLVAETAFGVASHVEQLLNRQRSLFERQLVAARGGALAADALTVVALTPDTGRPARIALNAEDGFGGLGWSRPEVDGAWSRRWMGRVAFIAAELEPDRPVLMRATISGTASPHLLRGLRVSTGRAYAPCWIEPDTDDPAAWFWTALIPPGCIEADGRARIALHADEAVTIGGGLKRSSVALRRVELAVAPLADTPDFRMDGGCYWFTKGWARGETTATPRLLQTLILLPLVSAPSEARLVLAGTGLDFIQTVALNGVVLLVDAASPGHLELVIPLELWRADALNELMLIWSSPAEGPSPVLSGLVARSATAPA